LLQNNGNAKTKGVAEKWFSWKMAIKTEVRVGKIFVQYVDLGGSVAKWLACWTQAQKGSGSNRSHGAVG